MQSEPQTDFSTEAAQAILSAVLGSAVTLDVVEPLGGSDRSKVVRCQVLNADADVPRFVVVKQAAPQENEPYDPRSTSGPAARLFNEWAALQFLEECFVGDSPVPRLFGGDREAGVIVMEDLGSGQRLDTLLLGSDAVAAESAMIELFLVIGRMHAATVGKGERYDQLREALGPRVSGHRTNDIEEHARAFLTFLNALGVKIPVSLAAELQRCIETARTPGPFAALIHCDPCPDNCLQTPSGIKLLDFEFAQFGHALWDGVYPRIHFPTCWCVNRIPREVVDRAESAYRRELSRGCAQAEDDLLFGAAVVTQCACALFLTLFWAMPEIMSQDSVWGIATLRQRVLVRLDAFVGAAVRWGHLPEMGAAARQVEEKLRGAWLPQMQDMPLYPAFRREAAR